MKNQLSNSNISRLIEIGVTKKSLENYINELKKIHPTPQKFVDDICRYEFTKKIKNNNFQPALNQNHPLLKINNTTLRNHLTELVNLITNAITHGKIHAFQHRQADWIVPKIELTIKDRAEHQLLKEQVALHIYRGMSADEYNSGNYGQSWTLDKTVAKRFAFETYEELNKNGLILSGVIDTKNVIYICTERDESEVIILSEKIHDTELI